MLHGKSKIKQASRYTYKNAIDVPTLKSQKIIASMENLGQIYNVLIILAITFLMAVILAALAYFVDLFSLMMDNESTTLQSNLLENISSSLLRN